MSKHPLKGHTSPRGRNASDGTFTSVDWAKSHPNQAQVERVPNPGYGAESSSPRGRDVKNGQFIPADAAKGRSDAVVEQVPHGSK